MLRLPSFSSFSIARIASTFSGATSLFWWMNEALADLLAVTNYPPHKRERTRIMVRRIMGRAEPTAWEYPALMGVIARAAKRVRRERAKTAAESRRESLTQPLTARAALPRGAVHVTPHPGDRPRRDRPATLRSRSSSRAPPRR